jgi:hypothetical protein
MFEKIEKNFNVAVLENNDAFDMTNFKNYLQSGRHRVGRMSPWFSKFVNFIDDIYVKGKFTLQN